MANHTVVVMGGGIGGIVAARRLRRRLDSTDRVLLIDRTASFVFSPSLLWTMTGARRPQQISRDRRRLRRAGIEVVEAEALEIEAGRHSIRTTSGEIRFDRLVVALGADLAPAAMPGFVEAAHNVYTVDGALAAHEALEHIDEGRIAVVVARLPYKCPAAPWETAFLAEAMLRRRGVRDRVTIDVYTPEPYPMPTAGPGLGEALAGMVAERGIELHAKRTLSEIDPSARELVLDGGERAGYDLLLGVPPHRAPEVLHTSGFAAETGFLPVDRDTLATSAEDVFAIGDATVIPIAGDKFLPKAGVFAEGEAEVVAANIAAELSDRTGTEAFDGTGGCFVELGDGRAAFASGNFYGTEAPEIEMRRPGRHWHAAKVAFERYWLRRWL